VLKIEMIERVEPEMVKKAGHKVLDLADREGWSSFLLYAVLVAMAEFLESEGMRKVSDDDICRN